MGSGASAVQTDKHVVVIGGGYAGTTLCLELQKYNIPFTLIDSRDCFHHNVAAIRALVDKEDFVKHTVIPLEPTFGKNFKRGKVVNIKPNENKVVLESGEEIGYDFLILATGTSGPFPVKFDQSMDREEAIGLYKSMYNKIAERERILVVGGGATGTELAAEIAYKYPNKKVTLLHSREKLVGDQFNDNFQRNLKGILKRYNVNYILGEKVLDIKDVPEDGPTVVKTNKGSEIEADLVFKTIGLPVLTTAYKSSLGHVMEESGHLKVNENLQVEGYDNIYAIGDCCNSADIKLAYIAGQQGTLVANNIKAILTGNNTKPWKAGSAPLLAILALSPESGLGQLANGWLMWECVAKRLKSRNVFVDMYWGNMKQTKPVIS